jgi:hypothetical protein
MVFGEIFKVHIPTKWMLRRKLNATYLMVKIMKYAGWMKSLLKEGYDSTSVLAVVKLYFVLLAVTLPVLLFIRVVFGEIESYGEAVYVALGVFVTGYIVTKIT